MKLYFSTAACSLSPHIVLEELGLPHELVQVNLKTGHFGGGRSLTEVSPKGYVPILELNNGEILTEGAVIVQYLADLKPEKKLIAPVGSMGRVRCQEWLTFISSELHKGFGPLFMEGVPDSFRKVCVDRLLQKAEIVEAQLSKTPYLLGQDFSVADAYLFTVMNWSGFVKVDISSFPAILAFMDRMKARPAVVAAMKAERMK